MPRIYCDTRKCLSCKTCEIACVIQHSRSGDLYKVLAEEPRLKRLVKVTNTTQGPFPLRCHHCEDAACIDACKTGATFRDPLNGKILIDRDKCVGCWMCVMVCPFGAVFPDLKMEKAFKCDLCEGHNGPACVSACPSHALYYEEFEEFEEQRSEEIGCGLTVSQAV